MLAACTVVACSRESGESWLLRSNTHPPVDSKSAVRLPPTLYHVSPCTGRLQRLEEIHSNMAAEEQEEAST